MKPAAITLAALACLWLALVAALHLAHLEGEEK